MRPPQAPMLSKTMKDAADAVYHTVTQAICRPKTRLETSPSDLKAQSTAFLLSVFGDWPHPAAGQVQL